MQLRRQQVSRITPRRLSNTQTSVLNYGYFFRSTWRAEDRCKLRWATPVVASMQRPLTHTDDAATVAWVWVAWAWECVRFLLLFLLFIVGDTIKLTAIPALIGGVSLPSGRCVVQRRRANAGHSLAPVCFLEGASGLSFLTVAK